MPRAGDEPDGLTGRVDRHLVASWWARTQASIRVAMESIPTRMGWNQKHHLDQSADRPARWTVGSRTRQKHSRKLTRGPRINRLSSCLQERFQDCWRRAQRTA